MDATAQQFAILLRSSADAFLWAVEQMPQDHWLVAPPRRFEEWPTARHAFHLLHYEQQIVLPSMRQWLGGPLPPSLSPDEDATQEETGWQASKNSPSIVVDFTAVRGVQIELLSRFQATDWDEMRDTIWGSVTLRWVITKTIPHTFEHAHDVLCLRLWWDMRG
jgi:hypothetical protein